MLRPRYIATLIVSLLSIVGAYGQLRSLPTREEIDRKLHPELSKRANRGIRGQSIALGTVDDTQSIEVEFELRNTTDKEVGIIAIRSLCSCLSVTTEPQKLEPGESIVLAATLDPAGRTGEFEHTIYIYTTLDNELPTERLTLRGEIATTNKFPHLSEHMGTLRLSRKRVTLDGLCVGATRSERIVVANAGDSDLSLSARPSIEGVGFELRPATLKAGQEGEIVVSYTPQRLPEHDIETVIVVEGCDAKPAERMIKITIKR